MPIPIAPSNLTATVLSSTQIKLAWHDNSTNENGFRIQRSPNGSTWAWLATTGANVISYSDATVASNIKYWYRVRAFNSVGISAWSNTASATSYVVGIAARYPGDVNIGSDPDVILADDFEGYTSPSQLTTKWSRLSGAGNLRIATEAGNYYSGSKSLEMQLPISINETVNSCWKDLSAKQDVIYFRAYTKFDAGFDVPTSSHNGLRITGGNVLTGSPAPANGTGFFLTSLQNNKADGSLHFPDEVQPGYNQIYAYWPKQRDGFGDHWFSDGWVRPGGAGLWLLNPTQYPDFKPIPVSQPQRGNWYCYELMTKLNTIGKNDGVVAWWINGQLDGQITNLFLRGISTLQIDSTALRLHAQHSERVNKKWYDNVVIAKKYIGPMA